MTLSKKITVSISFVLVVLAVLAWPFYQGLMHKGIVAFPWFYQFIERPTEYPTSQKLYSDSFARNAQKALTLLTKHQQAIKSPGISAAVAIEGKTIWAGSSGWADIESMRAVTPKTRFRIGSTSKALTGTGLARMYQSGNIELDAPIQNYFSKLPNDQWRNITVRQLASHLSGLPHYKENSDLIGFYRTLTLNKRYEDVQKAVDIFDDSDLLFEPGTQFSYSSLGTVLLSATMEKASEKPYLALMRKKVFEPLKMHNTIAEYENRDDELLASFYWNDKGRRDDIRKWRDVDLSHRLAGGGFISTPSDLVKLGMGVLNDDFLTEDTRKTIWTPRALPNGELPPYGYSIGWRVIKRKINDKLGEVTIVNHAGVSRGAQSWLMVLPELKMSVAVNINSNTDVFWDFGKVSMDIARLFLEEH